MAISEISVSKIYILATEPTNKVKDRFWFDTTNNLLKRYDGTSWKPISVSSDDVVVLSSGNKISLTNYLNTQIAALAEGIDSKQDKLKYYSEGNSYPSAVIGDTSASINFYAPDLSMFAIGKITINSDTGLIIDTTVSGSAISTSLPSSIDAASDNKILSEKAVTTALLTKQDKLTTYKELSSEYYDKQVRIDAGGGIYINGGEVGTIFENQFQVTAQAGIIDLDGDYTNLKGDQFNITADEFCLSANSLSGSTTIVSAISSTARDNKIPTEKAVADAISTKQNKLNFYSEVSGSTPSATISVANIKLEGSVAEGNSATTASGENSHAEGRGTTASAIGSHAEGGFTKAQGNYSHAEGNHATASASGSHAEGNNTTASGENSHAEGVGTKALGSCSHAEGNIATASGAYSHAEGRYTTASSDCQHTQGKYNIEDTNDKYADIIGNGSSNSARSNAATVSWDGISWSRADVRAGGTDQDNATYSLAALAEGIDSKQDKLNFYSEFGYVDGVQGYTSNFDAYNINIGSSIDYRQGYIKLNGQQITFNGSIYGTAVSTSIPEVASASDTKLASEKAIATAIDTKQNNLVYYHENVSANPTALINGAKSFVIEGTVKGLILDGNNGGITITNGNFETGQSVISIVNNSWENNSDPILFDIDGDGVTISDALEIPEIKNKQNSTDTALNTTDKTIVGAINELLASINANVITSTEQKRITTTSTASGIQMSTTAKVCMVSINPVKTNVGAIYISTSSDTAPTINPLYPDQMPKYKFPDASQVYIWSDVNGDSVDLTIEYYG